MSIEGVDYSGDHPDPRGLYVAGKRFACRYVGPGGAWKQLTAVEARALTDAGLSIVCIASGEADGMLGGYATGAQWAKLAHAHAVSLGMPPDRPIYMSCDFDVSAAQWPKVLDCLRGAASVLGTTRVGIYGGYDAIAWAARDRAARWLWQTYAWSEGRWHPAAHAHQYRNHVSLVGGTVDLDRTTVDYIGQWRVGDGSAPGPIGGSMGLYEDLMNTAKVRNIYADADEHPDLTLETVVNRIASATNAVAPDLDSLRLELSTRDTTQHAALFAKLTAILEAVQAMSETPMVDPVAVAAAFANRPELLDALASGVAARLAGIRGEIVMSGTLSGGIVPPAA